MRCLVVSSLACPKSMRPRRPSGRIMTFPGCGSEVKRPSSSTCCASTCVSSRRIFFTSTTGGGASPPGVHLATHEHMLCSHTVPYARARRSCEMAPGVAMPSLSSERLIPSWWARARPIRVRASSSVYPGSSVITSTSCETIPSTERGITTRWPHARCALLAIASMIRASRRKSVSATWCLRASLRSSITRVSQNLHAAITWSKSEAKSSRTSGYCTFTTTSRPSCSRAR
mmetsp:Transcript_47956/g.118717  ORF Transcript_47956/g.118717 Transcript_47956/m.118717 type:complete len:230 (+) Transcript_47956:846-1535(+)